MFKQGNVTILTEKQLNERYLTQSNSRTAKLTAEAIQAGYSIARIEQVELETFDYLIWDIQIALECNFPRTSKIQLGYFTDLSELDKSVVYCAFKELPYTTYGMCS